MSQLFFKKPLQAAIREGRKRTTIRRWSRPLLRVGSRAFAPGVGWLEIEAVESVDLERLGDDARADGFETAAGLWEVLRALYPDCAGDGKHWYRVRFNLPPAEPSSHTAARGTGRGPGGR